ncbi:hypothetical protein HOY80DRAFT_989772, partial [Tuber brumale]
FSFSLLLLFSSPSLLLLAELCFLIVVEDTHLKAGYEFVHAFHHLRYSTFYFFTLVPDIQNRSSCSPFGGVEKGCISTMKGIPLGS